MKTKMPVMVFTIILIAGCGPAFFKPPPYNYEHYHKPGTTETDTMKALLECGHTDPLGDLRLNTDETYQEKTERAAFAEICMINDGFILIHRRSLCKSIPTLKACNPENAHLIPTRDINRRLNSPYCKAYPKARACQP